MELSYLNNLLIDIKQTQSLNAKKALIKIALESHYGESVKLLLRHLYDPQITTGISKTSWNKATPNIDYPFQLNVKSILDYLHSNNSGKQETVNFMKGFDYCNPGVNFLTYSIVTKDINIGISRGTVEKFIEIPKFEIMLGVRPELDDIDWNREFILTQKLDGVNLTCFKRGTDIKFFTRQGKEVFGLGVLAREYLPFSDGVYFGEAIYDGPAKDRKELFRLTAGELSQKKPDKRILHYLFDYVSLQEWDSNQFICPYNKTYSHLSEIIQKASGNKIKIVPFVYKGHSKKEALQCLEKAKSQGWEGLVLRYCSSVYQKERSKDFVKLKPQATLDLRIIGFKEYKHPHLLGSFIVDYKGFPVNVGSGFTLEQRQEFWNNKDSLLGKIVEVQYLDESEDKNGKKSLRHPVFIRLREDKNTPSYN